MRGFIRESVRHKEKSSAEEEDLEIPKHMHLGQCQPALGIKLSWKMKGTVQEPPTQEI